MKDECKDCPLIEDCTVKDFVDLAAPQIPCPFKAANRLPKVSHMSKDDEKKLCPKCEDCTHDATYPNPCSSCKDKSLFQRKDNSCPKCGSEEYTYCEIHDAICCDGYGHEQKVK